MIWVCAKDHELVEGVFVLMGASSEDLGLDLLELLHGFAVLDVKQA